MAIWHISHLANLIADRTIYFACVNFFHFLNGDKLSQDPLDRFSLFLHQMIGICSNMTDLDRFLIPQWTLPWQPIKVEKSAFFADQLLCRAPFQNGLQYHDSDYKKIK